MTLNIGRFNTPLRNCQFPSRMSIRSHCLVFNECYSPLSYQFIINWEAIRSHLLNADLLVVVSFKHPNPWSLQNPYSQCFQTPRGTNRKVTGVVVVYSRLKCITQSSASYLNAYSWLFSTRVCDTINIGDARCCTSSCSAFLCQWVSGPIPSFQHPVLPHEISTVEHILCNCRAYLLVICIIILRHHSTVFKTHTAAVCSGCSSVNYPFAFVSRHHCQCNKVHQTHATIIIAGRFTR